MLLLLACAGGASAVSLGSNLALHLNTTRRRGWGLIRNTIQG